MLVLICKKYRASNVKNMVYIREMIFNEFWFGHRFCQFRSVKGSNANITLQNNLPISSSNPKTPASVCMMSTKSASSLESLRSGSRSPKHGPAGSKPEILPTRDPDFERNVLPVNPAIWLPRLWPIRWMLLASKPTGIRTLTLLIIIRHY